MSRRLTRKDSQEITRARLRQSATWAFAHHGIAGAKIEAIAEDAGYSRGAFYSNYKTKLELLVDLLREKQASEIARWREVLLEGSDAEESVTQLTARYNDLPDARERIMLNGELQLEAERNEAFRPIYEEYIDGILTEVRGLFELMFRRHGRKVPENLDVLLITARQLGLGLSTRIILGRQIAAQFTPEQIWFEFLIDLMNRSPPDDEVAPATSD